MPSVGTLLTKIFGSRNERLLKRYRRIVEQINGLEAQVLPLTDEQLRSRTQELRAAHRSGRQSAAAILPEAFAIIRESMDRHIGIREVFNPEQHFDPSRLPAAARAQYDSVQQGMIQSGEDWRRVPIPIEIYAAVRELYPESRPPFRARCFDVQLIGGLVLYEGKIAEMATGEGKTFVAPLACFMKALEGWHCHVVTVNDFLVRRDADWVRPAFENLGLTVGYIQALMEPGSDVRRDAYKCDITYGTNSEFGFDFLRDNMKERADLQVQGPLDFAIVDEVDSILIDEARTPLIISGAAHDDAPKYLAADKVARRLLELNRPWDQVERAVDAAKRKIKAAEGDEEKAKGREEKEACRRRREEAEKQLAEAEGRKTGLTQFYEVELDRKSVHMTHEGIAAAQEAAGVGSFYVGANMEWPHLMEQALRAHVVYELDKDYVVERGTKTGQMEVVIVDEYTGRKMVGRQWSDGLHQGVEAKEHVPIKQETQTLATITLQNFFKLYRQIAGMTGTAMTESEEFAKVYRLEVVAIPTNRRVIRADNDDRVYRTEPEKWNSIIEEIKQHSDAGRPVLVGTTSVEKSEMLSQLLTRKYGVQHEVLNAKQHEREAHIVALAGQRHTNQHGESVGNVTIATNMAGRGTDIKPEPETFFDVVSAQLAGGKDGGQRYVLKQRGSGKTIEVAPDSALTEVFQLAPSAKVVGGLHVIGTERHTARRIDNQLRGRSGRQGDPGSSRFYVSLQDDLMKMFAGEWTIRVLGWLGMEEGMSIEDKRISKGILRAQKKVEERNFLARKNLLEYDEVMDHQRTSFYGMRQQVLEGREIDLIIWDMIGASIADAVGKYITQDYVSAVISEWARANFSVTMEPEDFKGIRGINELEELIKDRARNEAVQTIQSTLVEFTGEDTEDRTAWNIEGLQSWAQSQFQVELKPSQIRTMDAQELQEQLARRATEQIASREVDALLKYLEPRYAERELCNWAREKFGIEVEPGEMILDERSGRLTRQPSEQVVAMIEKRARAQYARREVEYPIDHVLAAVTRGQEVAAIDDPYLASALAGWIKGKYRLDLPLVQIRTMPIARLRSLLIEQQELMMVRGGIEQQIDALVGENADPSQLARAAGERLGVAITPADLAVEQPVAADAADNGALVEPAPSRTSRDVLVEKLRQLLRRELTDLEQFVLIQIFDQSWKDHLYAMDLLKSSIGLHAFAERDPRVLYKKEGSRYFQEMMAGIRDKVTDLIFRARVVGQVQARSAYRVTAAVHEGQAGYGVAEAVQGEVAAPGGADQQAAAQQAAEARVQTITRNAPRVGRNDPCPCGSGKKYKKCCGAAA
jgi:preprotein translocase subunit SecA